MVPGTGTLFHSNVLSYNNVGTIDAKCNWGSGCSHPHKGKFKVQSTLLFFLTRRVM